MREGIALSNKVKPSAIYCKIPQQTMLSQINLNNVSLHVTLQWST